MISDGIPLRLVRMVLEGRCTLEALDQPSPGWMMLQRDAPRLSVDWNLTPRPYRNLAREWIAANPTEWSKLQKEAGVGND